MKPIFPFRSAQKLKSRLKHNMTDMKLQDTPCDKRLKPRRKFFKPDFARYPYTWEVDFIESKPGLKFRDRKLAKKQNQLKELEAETNDVNRKLNEHKSTLRARTDRRGTKGIEAKIKHLNKRKVELRNDCTELKSIIDTLKTEAYVPAKHKTRVTYLVCVNCNTRYLYMIPVYDKTNEATKEAIEGLINYEMHNFGHPVDYLKGDAEASFQSLATSINPPTSDQEPIKFKYSEATRRKRRILAQSYARPKNFFIKKAGYVNSSKIVDSTIRTIRNMLGIGNQHKLNGDHYHEIAQLTNIYNTTYHASIGMEPIEMHTDIDMEWFYIRYQTERLNRIKKLQLGNKILNYKPGDDVRVHIDWNKSSNINVKRRLNFDLIGVFEEYVDGNALVFITQAPEFLAADLTGVSIEVPIAHTCRLEQK